MSFKDFTNPLRDILMTVAGDSLQAKAPKRVTVWPLRSLTKAWGRNWGTRKLRFSP
jgi:hypothetical protein